MILTEISQWPQSIQKKIIDLTRKYKKVVKQAEITTDMEEAVKHLDDPRNASVSFNMWCELDVTIFDINNLSLLNGFFYYLAKKGWEPISHRVDTQNSSIYYNYKKERVRDEPLRITITVILKGDDYCKRVKVGTKMVGEDIYEIQCGGVKVE